MLRLVELTLGEFDGCVEVASAAELDCLVQLWRREQLGGGSQRPLDIEALAGGQRAPGSFSCGHPGVNQLDSGPALARGNLRDPSPFERLGNSEEVVGLTGVAKSLLVVTERSRQIPPHLLGESGTGVRPGEPAVGVRLLVEGNGTMVQLESSIEIAL